MEPRIFEYDSASHNFITYTDENAYWTNGDKFTPLTYTYKKFCYTSYSEFCSPISKIYTGKKAYSLYPGAVLYVSKDSKVSRDRIRNSGFKITYDKSKTKFIVIPAWPIRKEESIVYAANIVVNKDNNLYLVKLTKSFSAPDKITPQLKEKIFMLVKEKFGKDADISYLPELESFKLCFFPDIEEYKEVFVDTTANVYIPDDRLPLTIQTEINTETLIAWEKMEPDAMAIAFIMSDYKNYPVTSKVFLGLYESQQRLSYNTQFTLALKELGYVRFQEPRHYKPVEAKDWNMLQDWAMKRLGVSENGGYIKHADGSKDIFSYLSRYINRRVAVKPYKLEEGQLSFTDLLAGAGK